MLQMKGKFECTCYRLKRTLSVLGTGEVQTTGISSLCVSVLTALW